MTLARGEGKAVRTAVFGVWPFNTSAWRDSWKSSRELRAAVSVARLETTASRAVWVARAET